MSEKGDLKRSICIFQQENLLPHFQLQSQNNLFSLNWKFVKSTLQGSNFSYSDFENEDKILHTLHDPMNLHHKNNRVFYSLVFKNHTAKKRQKIKDEFIKIKKW